MDRKHRDLILASVLDLLFDDSKEASQTISMPKQRDSLGFSNSQTDLMPCSTFSSDDIVIKSPNDNKLYRLIELENGLTALLLHDPDIYPQHEAAKAGGGELKNKGNGGAFQTKKVCVYQNVEMSLLYYQNVC